MPLHFFTDIGGHLDPFVNLFIDYHLVVRPCKAQRELQHEQATSKVKTHASTKHSSSHLSGAVDLFPTQSVRKGKHDETCCFRWISPAWMVHNINQESRNINSQGSREV